MTFSYTTIIIIVTEETAYKLFTWNFSTVIFVQEFKDWVSLSYRFVTVGSNIQNSNFKYLCIIDKKASKKVNQKFVLQFSLFLVIVQVPEFDPFSRKQRPVFP